MIVIRVLFFNCERFKLHNLCIHYYMLICDRTAGCPVHVL